MTDELVFEEGRGKPTPLRAALEAACAIEMCSLKSLTVLSKGADPFRLDTPANHVLGKWIAEQINRAFRPHQRVHIRGLHYAVLTREGGVRKPDGAIYRNTAEDADWLDQAMKAARWLAYVPFERISDNRNNEPDRYRSQAPAGRPVKIASAGVNWLGELEFDLGTLDVSRPHPVLLEFTRAQPYALHFRREVFDRGRSRPHRPPLRRRPVPGDGRG
jgi:hypothetical protein